MPLAAEQLREVLAGELAALVVVGRDEADVVVRPSGPSRRSRPARFAHRVAHRRDQRRSSSGASAMPDTPRAKRSRPRRPASRDRLRASGPRQMMSTPSSAPPLRAPAWMLCQNTCDVPLGMTAISAGKNALVTGAGIGDWAAIAVTLCGSRRPGVGHRSRSTAADADATNRCMPGRGHDAVAGRDRRGAVRARRGARATGRST